MGISDGQPGRVAGDHSISNPEHRRRVLLDVDGVLADFVGAFLDVVHRVTGRRYNREHVTGMDIGTSLALTRDESIMCCRYVDTTPGFCESIALYPGAQDGVARLHQIADVFIVTAQWNSCPTWTHERERWLELHFGIRADHVIHTSAKHIVAGDYLVDDKVSTCIAWQHENPRGRAIIWDTPHNQRAAWDDGMRTSSWSALCRFVRPLRDELDERFDSTDSDEPVVR